MTFDDVRRRLAAAGIPDAENDARLLIQSVTGLSPAMQRADRTRDYDLPALEQAVCRREAREPLQYILGEWQFYRQTFEVNQNCLIPRADTELLVEYAVAHLPRGAHFADLCTGSGCIAVSVLAERPDTTADALELYPETLAVACRNAKRNGVEARFCGVLADVCRGEGIAPDTRYDALLSNPPYIPSKTVGTLEPEVLREPRAALDGGEDGMTFYRAILENYTGCLKPEGLILFEIGYDEGDAIRSLAGEHGFGCSVLRDLGGNDRLALLTRGA